MWIDNGANIYESYIRNWFNSRKPNLQIPTKFNWVQTCSMVTLSQALHDLVMKVQRLHGVGSVLRNTRLTTRAKSTDDSVDMHWDSLRSSESYTNVNRLVQCSNHWGATSYFNGLLAQTVEQWTFNPLVNGSNPLQPTILISELRLGVSLSSLVKILKNKVGFCDRTEYIRCVCWFNLRTFRFVLTYTGF